MRFLKQKIALAGHLDKQDNLNPKNKSKLKKKQLPKPKDKRKKRLIKRRDGIEKRNRVPGNPLATYQVRSTKNIVQNYGRAICNYSLSNIALPYLVHIIERNGLQNIC